MNQNSAFRIDLDKILREPRNITGKSPFLISYLKRIVHQEDINGILNETVVWRVFPLHALVERSST